MIILPIDLEMIGIPSDLIQQLPLSGHGSPEMPLFMLE